MPVNRYIETGLVLHNLKITHLVKFMLSFIFLIYEKSTFEFEVTWLVHRAIKFRSYIVYQLVQVLQFELSRRASTDRWFVPQFPQRHCAVVNGNFVYCQDLCIVNDAA